jgi:serine/threonine protein kinase
MTDEIIDANSVERMSDLKNKTDILRVLNFVPKDLISQNQSTFSELLKQAIDAECLAGILQYMQSAHGINQSTFTLSVNLCKQKNNHLTSLINVFVAQNTKIHLEDVDALLKLHQRDFYRLERVCTEFSVANALNAENFHTALARVTTKLPKPTESTLKKDRRKLDKDAENARSKIMLDNSIEAYIEHNAQPGSKKHRYIGGQFGIIKKLYQSRENSKINYAQKNFFASDEKEAQREAQRETKYHRALGREAYYYSTHEHRRHYLVYQWFSEKALEHFSENDLKQISLLERLKAVISLLEEINTLHAKYRVHGDVKPLNVIYDSKNAQMRLIDFGGTHKNLSSKTYPGTLIYRDTNKGTCYECSDDIYSLGITVAQLFPELFFLLDTNLPFQYHNIKPFQVVILHNDTSAFAQAIVFLVQEMVQKQKHDRCTALEAIQFCQGLIQHHDQLDDKFLKEFGNATIRNKQFSVENVLRGKYTL